MISINIIFSTVSIFVCISPDIQTVYSCYGRIIFLIVEWVDMVRTILNSALSVLKYWFNLIVTFNCLLVSVISAVHLMRIIICETVYSLYAVLIVAQLIVIILWCRISEKTINLLRSFLLIFLNVSVVTLKGIRILLLNIWLEIGRVVSLRVSICVLNTFRFTVANQTLMKKATAVIFIQRYLLKRILIIISAAISIIFLFYSLRILFLVLAP